MASPHEIYNIQMYTGVSNVASMNSKDVFSDVCAEFFTDIRYHLKGEVSIHALKKKNWQIITFVVRDVLHTLLLNEMLLIVPFHKDFSPSSEQLEQRKLAYTL